MSVSYRPSISLKVGHLAEEQRCYDFSIYYDFDYGHNGSDNCMESNLPEDYYEDYYSDTVQNAYELLCSTDEVSYYLGLGFFVWYTGNKDMIDDKECEYSFSEKTWTIISKSKIITQSVIIRYITLM